MRSKYFIRVSVFHSGAISLAVRRISLKKHRQCRCFFYHAERDFSSASRLSRHKWLTHIGKNSPPDCFLPQIYRFAPSLFESLYLYKKTIRNPRKWISYYWHAERDFPHTIVCYRLAFARYPRALQPFAERLQFATWQTALVRIPYIKRKSKSQPKGYTLLFGTLKGIRTPDPLLRSHLYRYLKPL